LQARAAEVKIASERTEANILNRNGIFNECGVERTTGMRGASKTDTSGEVMEGLSHEKGKGKRVDDIPYTTGRTLACGVLEAARGAC
jgi:hypothetical protein